MSDDDLIRRGDAFAVVKGLRLLEEDIRNLPAVTQPAPDADLTPFLDAWERHDWQTAIHYMPKDKPEEPRFPSSPAWKLAAAAIGGRLSPAPDAAAIRGAAQPSPQQVVDAMKDAAAVAMKAREAALREAADLVNRRVDGVRVSIPCPDGKSGCLVHHFRIEDGPTAKAILALLTEKPHDRA